jgi:hypothetical protein
MSENSREDARRVAKELGWSEVVPNGKGYLKLLCPCGKHKVWLHKTPSGVNYFKNVIKFLRRQPCSKAEK